LDATEVIILIPSLPVQLDFVTLTYLYVVL
jgi:hypothetical protein